MIPGLDGLRAIAFILVFLIHTNFIQIGWVGVLLFFVLSGYLITGILVEMKENLSIKAYFIKFYGRRFLRIFPLYYFYLFLMLALAYWLYSIGYRPNQMLLFFRQAPYALTYVYDFFLASKWWTKSDFIVHFWSLSVEEQFYVVWPLVIFLTPRKAYKGLFIGAIIAGPILRAGIYYLYVHHAFSSLGSIPADGVYALPFSYVDAFGLGAFASQFRIPKARLQFWILLFAVPMVGYVTEYMVAGKIENWSSLGYTLPVSGLYKEIWGYSLLNYLFAITIYAVAREGLFNRFLELGWMKYLGRISYGLYVYHFILISFINRILNDRLPLTYEQNQALTVIPAFAATVLVAGLSFKYIEKPLINFKDKFFATTPRSVPKI